MSHPIKLSIHVENRNEVINVSGEFPDNEWVSLKDFKQYSEELFESNPVKKGIQASLNIGGNSQGVITYETKLPPWDDVTIFLHKLRPFILKNETTHFFNICNFISHRIEDEYIRSIVAMNRDLYTGRTLKSYFSISVNDVVINSEKMLSAWLNSYEYHRDKEKKAFVDLINEYFPFDASKVIFIQLLTEKLKAIGGITSLVSVLLGDIKSASGKIRIDNL